MNKTIICYIATLTRGGAEKVMVGLANYMASQGHNVYLATLEPDEGLYQIDGRIHHIIMKESGSTRFSRAISRITNLRKLIKKVGADSILAFMGKTNIRAILAALGTPCRSYVSVRSAPEKEYPGFFRRTLARAVFCLADGIIFQSEGARSFFPALCCKKSRIILNPLGIAYFEDAGDPPGEIRREMITAGRLTGIKNHALLIDAFNIFHKNHPDYRLIIYGEGECREAMERQIASLGLQAAVSLPGDEKNIRQKMEGAALFVLSSDFEGMPNAIAEAMALKIPVIATDAPSGGIRALVGDNERGLLVPVRDPESMAAAMERLNSDPGLLLRLRTAAYDFAQGLHPDLIHRQWVDYILR